MMLPVKKIMTDDTEIKYLMLHSVKNNNDNMVIGY